MQRTNPANALTPTQPRLTLLFSLMLCAAVAVLSAACGASSQAVLAPPQVSMADADEVYDEAIPLTGSSQAAAKGMPESAMEEGAGDSGESVETEAISFQDLAPQAPRMAAVQEHDASGPSSGGAASTQVPTEVSDAASVQQILVYTASITMAVYEVDKAIGAVEVLARESGGFVSQKTLNAITIRVPPAHFDSTIEKITAMGDVLGRDVQVHDITEEYMDLALRLRNARQVRDRIAELLASAKTVEESIKVERELHRLREEIERLEGRLKYLTNKAQFSTVTVRFQASAAREARSKFRLPFPWLSNLGLGRLMNLY